MAGSTNLYGHGGASYPPPLWYASQIMALSGVVDGLVTGVAAVPEMIADDAPSREYARAESAVLFTRPAGGGLRDIPGLFVEVDATDRRVLLELHIAYLTMSGPVGGLCGLAIVAGGVLLQSTTISCPVPDGYSHGSVSLFAEVPVGTGVVAAQGQVLTTLSGAQSFIANDVDTISYLRALRG